MDPKIPQYWADLLWKYFKPQVASEKPVYFTVSSNLLVELFKKSNPQSNVNPEIAEAYFNTACSKLLIFGKNKITVNPLTFKKQENGFSCSIVLAAQQILVVEEMASDDNFSPDAYFPLYRKKINFRKAVNHSNPFKGLDEFVQIWEILKEDIQTISGWNNYSITFKEGRSKKNMTRNFPISQALFSQNDLQSLRELATASRIDPGSSLSPSRLQYFFDKNKLSLTKRSQNKIKIEGMRHALYSQFLNYLKIPEEKLTKKKNFKENTPGPEVEGGIFVISLKASGFRKIYCLRYKIDFEKTFFGDQMQEHFKNFTNQGDIFIFSKVAGALGFSNLERSGEVNPGDSFILFYKNEKRSVATTILVKFLGVNWEKTFSRIDVEGSSGYSFFYCRKFPDGIGGLAFNSGRLVTEFIPAKERIICSGGVMLDKTQGLYLKGYPPHEFKAGSFGLGPNEIVTVNEAPMTITELKEKLSQVDSYNSFRVQYKEFRVELKIKSAKENRQYHIKPIGFNLIDDACIAPLASENELDSPSLRGWVINCGIPGEKMEFELELFEVAWLMKAVDRIWIPANEKAIKLVIKNLPVNTPRSLQKVLEDRLFSVKALPRPIIIRHKVLEVVNVT